MRTSRTKPVPGGEHDTQIHPQLSHCGVYARDIDKMVAFYTETIGLVVSDRGVSGRGGELAFMTAAPGHHHQLVVVSGRAPDGVSTVNQLSFKVGDLDQLKETHRRVRDAGVTEGTAARHPVSCRSGSGRPRSSAGFKLISTWCIQLSMGAKAGIQSLPLA
jgi:catechol 2,3-dioxygenase-like lactoylglutathione lyase family enzyme